MSTKRVLEIAELLDIIIHFLRTDRPDLYRVAQVSKTFSQHTLKYLWRTLPTALPIMKLVPGIAKRRRQFTFVRKPTNCEWGPFLTYAPMIFEIEDVYSCGVEDVSVGTYADIKKYLPNSRQLFPSLRVLVLPVGRECPIQRGLRIQDARALLSSPMLLDVHIAHPITSRRRAEYDASTIDAFATLLTQCSTSIQRFRLTGHLRTDTAQLINQLKDLRYLDCNFSELKLSFHSPFALQGLHHLQNLTVLLLSLSPGTAVPQQLPTRLHQLKKLALNGDISLFLGICGLSPNITHLILRISQHSVHISSEPPSTWCSFFRKLQSMCPSVRRLDIRNHLWNERGLKIFEHIEPLFPLALESFYISSLCLYGSHLSDDEVREIGLAWPNLQHLDLFAEARYISPNIPTGQAIFTLMRACGDLRYIRMGIENEIYTLYTSFPCFNLIDTFQVSADCRHHSIFIQQYLYLILRLTLKLEVLCIAFQPQ